MIIVLMGVSGCGKTVIGEELSRELGIPFYDADDFHSEANKRKMKEGKALTDTDRKPWLKNLADFMQAHGEMILACSALKHAYRRILRISSEVKFVYLKGAYPLIRSRLEARKGHFFNPELLDSQFATLEEPRHALVVDVALPIPKIVSAIQQGLKIEKR
ncbi:MAG: gluconokinase [Chlamydiia bacterium]|nr:gluconokinase [Chlamydiia bacterium]